MEEVLYPDRNLTQHLSHLLLVSAVLFAAAGCGNDKEASAVPTAAIKQGSSVPPRAAMEVAAVVLAPKDLPVVKTFVAQTESSRAVDIVARVSGFLDRIAYEEGQLVQEGQVLFQLDQKPFLAQLDAARGELKQQEARSWTARANYKRIKPLAAENAVSQSDLDRATGEMQAAAAAVFAAQAKVKEAELNLSYTTIRSPVTGTASKANLREGAYINSISPEAKLTYVAALTPMWVNFSVTQNQMAEWRDDIEQGNLIEPKNREFEVEILLSDGATYPETGRINFLDPSFNTQTGTFLVRATVSNPKGQLRPGMFVTAKLAGAMRPNAILVPQKAVQQGASGHFVYLVSPNNTAELRPVIVGEYVGEEWVIKEGLRGGERVVIDGLQRLAPGAPVKLAEASSTGPDAGGSKVPAATN
ncbi:MAG: efflux RND transporter periplasmic adaptor subunit [Gammaproteobacteria bacterium]